MPHGLDYISGLPSLSGMARSHDIGARAVHVLPRGALCPTHSRVDSYGFQEVAVGCGDRYYQGTEFIMLQQFKMAQVGCAPVHFIPSSAFHSTTIHSHCCQRGGPFRRRCFWRRIRPYSAVRNYSAVGYGHQICEMADPISDFRITQASCRRLRPSWDRQTAISLQYLHNPCEALGYIQFHLALRKAALTVVFPFVMLQPGTDTL